MTWLGEYPMDLSMLRVIPYGRLRSWTTASSKEVRMVSPTDPAASRRSREHATGDARAINWPAAA
jgi:hypothetical protein